MKRVLTTCVSVLLLAACTPQQVASPRPALDAYKKAVALHVAQNAPGAYCQPADEELLKSVVVLDLTVDGAGKLVDASVYRTNGYPELAQVALQRMLDAGPLPAPTTPLINGSGTLEFLETFLFREDDCFLIRSLVD
jgi:periplasmic protein TonB